MTSLRIVLGTAGILGLIYVGLAVAVMRQRFKNRVSLGDGGGDKAKASLLVAVRMHGNFGEYVPFALLLMAGISWAGMGPYWVGGLAVALIAGRVLHIAGLGLPAPNWPRALGMLLTWGVLIMASVQAILLAA